jgi:hypothetical protein
MKNTATPADFALVFAILVWLFAAWILLWTLAFTAPTFAALQQRGIQKNALVASKLPYNSICSGRTCKSYVLRVSFFTDTDSIQTIRVGELVFAELEVTEAEYNATKPDDKKRIIYLEESPKEVWLAAQALAWRPLGNYLVGLGLVALGGVLFALHRRLRPLKPTHGGRL